MKYVYACKENADKTEGRGPMRTYATFSDEATAVSVAKDRGGVMGRKGDGEVWRVPVFASRDDWAAGGEQPERIWGYRQGLAGRWEYGYIDWREDYELQSDPEFQTYLRLKAKFA